MAKEPETIVSEMAPPPTPVTRLGIRLRVLLQLLLAFVILVSAFYLGILYYKQKDLTQHSDFTVSEQTVNLLESSALQDREEPVKIIAALRKTSPHYERLRILIEEYGRLAKGKIVIDHLDPIRDQDRALEVANNYSDLLADQLFSDDLFIIDARGSAVTNESTSLRDRRIQAINSGLRYVRVEDMLVKRTDDKKQRRIIGYQDEDMLTSYLQSAIEGLPRVMYLLSDKSDIEAGDASSPGHMLTETLGRLNVILAPIRISEIESIPQNAEGVVIAGPQYDLSRKELEILEEYWKRKSSSLLFYLNPSAKVPNLTSFLRRHGVTPRNDRILKVRNGRTDSQVQAIFSENAEVNRVTVSLEGKPTRFEGRVSSLEVREDAEDLVTQGIQCFSVIEAAPGFWGEVDFTEPQPTFDDASDHPGPLFIGAAVIKGNANVDRSTETIGKMIILSTSDFLHPDRMSAAQLDFVKNTTHWLLGREELMGIGPRGLERRKLNLIPSEATWLQNIAVFFIPTGFLLAALFVWNARRA
ncbi:MAG: hypothetical protein ACSHYF_01050 [Verrucomicrobiaceae bacterium]